MRNLGCLVLFILLLPILLIVIGPLLVLAAVRGRQPVGPITLDTWQYGAMGRIGSLLLGLALWILVWGGLGWIIINGYLPQSDNSIIPPTIAAVATPLNTTNTQATATRQPESTATTPPDTATPAIESSTATPDDPVDTPTVLVIIDVSPVSTTQSVTPTATLTRPANDTPEPTIIALAATPNEESEDSADVAETETFSTTLSTTDRQDVLNTVAQANDLLREATSLANEENIENLEGVWQDRALEKTKIFATDIYTRYAKPFDVTFEYITPPTIYRTTPTEVVVTSQEMWTYKGRSEINKEAFEFSYTLSQQEDGRWVITYYSYLNLPTPTPTTSP